MKMLEESKAKGPKKVSMAIKEVDEDE